MSPDEEAQNFFHDGSENHDSGLHLFVGKRFTPNWFVELKHADLQASATTQDATRGSYAPTLTGTTVTPGIQALRLAGRSERVRNGDRKACSPGRGVSATWTAMALSIRRTAVRIHRETASSTKRGCAIPMDVDNDGVRGNEDRCPDTVAGVPVDARGCEVADEIRLQGVHFETNSERRAKTVRDLLINSGVADERLSWRGYGESGPIADNATAEGREQNRRVVLRILRR